MEPGTYAAFNLTEAVAWTGLAAHLWRTDLELQAVEVRLGLPVLLLAFAGTDLAEAAIQGSLPPWLWWSKLLIGATLFGLANYREHLAFGTVTVEKMVLRSIAFVLLLGLYFRVTQGRG